MSFGDRIDAALAPFAPRWAARRMNARVQLAAAEVTLDGMRKIQAGAVDRRTVNWNRQQTSAPGESLQYGRMLAGAGYDLFQNNKYAAASARQLVASIWGDGIAVQIDHPVKRVREKAQSEWNRFAEGRVDDLGDWYGMGKVSVLAMIVGGESVQLWQPDDGDRGGPFGRMKGMEGAYIDSSKNFRLTDGGKIVQGVHYDRMNRRVGFWLFQDHPNDPLGGGNTARFVSEQYVDHLFERTRHDQVRGLSWFGAVATTLQDIGDIEDAKRLQAKVQACLALVVTPGDGNGQSPLALGEQAPAANDRPGRPLEESVRPGAIVRLGPGEKSDVINPTPAADTVMFIKQQLAGVSASMVPYHLMTGDVSEANYSGLRAAMNGSYGLVDDWQQNTVIPQYVRPSVERRMRRLVMETGDRRFLDCRYEYALPVRRLVDPVKDLLGEIMEIRAGLKTLSRGLAERGLNDEAHLNKIAQMNSVIDTLGLALDSDPRRLTDSGVLQAAAGYLAPRAGGTQED